MGSRAPWGRSEGAVGVACCHQWHAELEQAGLGGRGAGLDPQPRVPGDMPGDATPGDVGRSRLPSIPYPYCACSGRSGARTLADDGEFVGFFISAWLR